MAFKGLEEHAKRSKEEYMSHVRDLVRDLCNGCEMEGRKLTWQDWQYVSKDGLNSWERELIYPLLDNEALIRLLEESILPNCQPPGYPLKGGSYDTAVVSIFAPLLIERLKATE